MFPSRIDLSDRLHAISRGLSLKQTALDNVGLNRIIIIHCFMLQRLIEVLHRNAVRSNHVHRSIKL